MLLNLHTDGGQYLVSNMTVRWEQLGLPAGTSATVRDLYAERDLGQHTDAFTAEVTAHDVVVVKISPMGSLEKDSWRPWHSQPIYAKGSGDAEPRAGDLIRRGSTQASQAAAGIRAGGRQSSGSSSSTTARKMAPGGQHGMFGKADV